MRQEEMPYLNCPNCRLTLYSAAAHSTVDSCPRCDTALGGPPRRMFDSTALDGRAKHNDSAVTSALTATKKSGHDRHSLIREALKGTGHFRDRGGSQGETPAA